MGDQVQGQVLEGNVGQQCRASLREIPSSQETVIYAGAINRDRVHILIDMPSYISVPRVVQYLKGKGSNRLLTEYA